MIVGATNTDTDPDNNERPATVSLSLQRARDDPNHFRGLFITIILKVV